LHSGSIPTGRSHHDTPTTVFNQRAPSDAHLVGCDDGACLAATLMLAAPVCAAVPPQAFEAAIQEFRGPHQR
jgi:hypothetical protein